jgi:hypothetical protein
LYLSNSLNKSSKKVRDRPVGLSVSDYLYVDAIGVKNFFDDKIMMGWISQCSRRSNWNVGMMEYWKFGFWDTSVLE